MPGYRRERLSITGGKIAATVSGHPINLAGRLFRQEFDFLDGLLQYINGSRAAPEQCSAVDRWFDAF